jgi:hypothetical protein
MSSWADDAEDDHAAPDFSSAAPPVKGWGKVRLMCPSICLCEPPFAVTGLSPRLSDADARTLARTHARRWRL